MPQAAAHILIPLIILSLFRDKYLSTKRKRHFPLHYVLIGAIAGIIPDLDIVLFWFLSFFNFSLNEVHRTFSHTLFIPAFFSILAIFTIGLNNHALGRHKLKTSNIFWMLAFGSSIHLILDGTLAGYIIPLYPLIDSSIGLNLFGLLPYSLESLAAPSLDAGLLILYLIYLEVKHKISDFI